MKDEHRKAIEIANNCHIVSEWQENPSDEEDEWCEWLVPDSPDSTEVHRVRLDPASCTCRTYARLEGHTGWDRSCRHLLAVMIDGARANDLAVPDEMPFVVSDMRPK